MITSEIRLKTLRGLKDACKPLAKLTNMLKSEQPEKPKKVYVIPKVSKKRAAAIASGEFKPKPAKPIAPRSKKRISEERKYATIRLIFLDENPICQARIKCNGALATEIHHMAGRIGKLLTDRSKFKALCHECHEFAELNPEQAKALGISENRL